MRHIISATILQIYAWRVAEIKVLNIKKDITKTSYLPLLLRSRPMV